MDIYTDYANWKFENYEFIKALIEKESKTISRFTSVIAVVDYLYDRVVNKEKLTEDEDVIFGTGFDYIFDQFHYIKTLLEYKFNNDIEEMEKYSKTINLLLYIHDFQAEALEQPCLNPKDMKPLDDLEDKVNSLLDKKENISDEYFALLNDITEVLFEQKSIEVHTIDQIFYEIALEYGIYHENDIDVYNIFLNKEIEKRRSN